MAPFVTLRHEARVTEAEDGKRDCEIPFPKQYWSYPPSSHQSSRCSEHRRNQGWGTRIPLKSVLGFGMSLNSTRSWGGGGVEFASVHILLGRVGPECSAGEVLQFFQVGLFNSGPSVAVLGWLILTCKDQLVNFQRLCELVVKHRHSILNDVNL